MHQSDARPDIQATRRATALVRSLLVFRTTASIASGRSLVEVDPHHDAPARWPADLGEYGAREDAAAADVELAPGDLLPGLGDHRIALDRTGAARACEVDGGARERSADAAAPEAGASDEAGHGPDAVVGLVLRATNPGDAAVAPQVLTTIFARCEQSAECHGHFPALRQDYNAIKERLTRNPLVVRVADADVTLDTTVLQTALAQLLTSRQLAASVPMLVHTFATDGMEPASKLASAMSELMRADDVAYGTNLAFHCNDTPIESSTPAWLRSRCPVWVGPQYGDHNPAPLNSDVPALIMVGEFDPRTPPSYAHALAAGLTHAPS